MIMDNPILFVRLNIYIYIYSTSLDKVVFYFVTVVFYAGDKGMILREGGCVFAEELSSSRHSKWDSTSFLLLSLWQLSRE